MKVKKGDRVLVRLTVYGVAEDRLFSTDETVGLIPMDFVDSIIESPVDWERVERGARVVVKFRDSPSTHEATFITKDPIDGFKVVLDAHTTVTTWPICRLVEPQQ